ncbi:MAG: DMT family transporter [Mobilitalea sp.]
MKNKNYNISIVCAFLAAVFYAICAPISKLLLSEIPAAMMAALLYLGAGIGMSIISINHRFKKVKAEISLSKNDLPYIIGMILLDIVAPIFLMLGLSLSSPANVSLLNNFEIVTTSLIALIIFKEFISRRVWLGIILVTIASIILSLDEINTITLSYGSIFVILACICWGFENNCTKMLSKKDPMQIVIVKGLGSGMGALLISFLLNEISTNIIYIILTLVLGFVSYGLSIYFYVSAQRELGAARTSAYYAIAPFIGVAISFIIFKEKLTLSFILSFIIMIIGTYLISTVEKKNQIIKLAK